MLHKYNQYYIQYLEIRNEIDILSEKLGNKHKKEMKCKSGCDFCCMDYRILPVEFYSIINEMAESGFNTDSSSNQKNESDCVFLKESLCTIYLYRPVICRTHGLPLLFANDDGEWELSACDLNFTNYNFEKFTLKNTFPQDKFNSRIFMLNKEFISEFQEVKYKDTDIIPIRKLLEKQWNSGK